MFGAVVLLSAYLCAWGGRLLRGPTTSLIKMKLIKPSQETWNHHKYMEYMEHHGTSVCCRSSEHLLVCPVTATMWMSCLKLANSQALFDPACNEVLAEILVDGSSRQKISSATGRFQRVSRCPMATYNEPGLSTHERRNTAKSKSYHAKVTVSLSKSLQLGLGPRWCKKT